MARQIQRRAITKNRLPPAAKWLADTMDASPIRQPKTCPEYRLFLQCSNDGKKAKISLILPATTSQKKWPAPHDAGARHSCTTWAA